MPYNAYQRLQYARQREKQKLLAQGYGKVYYGAGVYQITVDGILVYIGKADDLLNRLVDHKLETNRSTPREHKYEVLKEAKQKNHKVSFSVLYYAKNTIPADFENEICEKEGELIRKYLPPLNYKIPNEENYNRYSVNPKAKIITLQEILAS